MERIYSNRTNIQAILRDSIFQKGGFVNSHSHLDRADTGTIEMLRTAQEKDVRNKWELVDDIKRNSTEGQIQDRMMRVIEEQIAQGVQVLGSFIDSDPIVGEKAMNAARKTRDVYKNDIKLIFMTQTLKGVLDRQAREWFERGAEWADIIGGLPAKDVGYESEHLDVVLQTAKRLNKRVHVHVDQEGRPDERETELLIAKTKEHGMKNKVTAIHAISIASQPKDYREWIYKELANLGISVVACPTAWMDRQRSEALAPIHNSVTPFDEMYRYGIKVAIGTDNIRDIYSPWNNGDLLEEVVRLAQLTRTNDIRLLTDVGSKNGLYALGLLNEDHHSNEYINQPLPEKIKVG